MRIVQVHIVSFGKLRNVQLQFDRNLNIIQQNNGFGKTTLANFIRAMLYGFKYTRNKNAFGFVSDVGEWITWNSTEKIGGSMVVEHDGETYRIERYFGATQKQESCRVTNEKSGKPVTVETSVGEYFLGLTAESFDRSAYFPQESVEIKSTENFDSRLAGIVQNAENFDKVCNGIKQYQSKLVSGRRDHAVIPDLEEKQSKLQHQLADIRAASMRRNDIDCSLQQIETKSAELQKESEKLGNLITEADRKLAQLAPSVEQTANAQKLADLAEKIARAGNIEQDKQTCDDLLKRIKTTPEAAKKHRSVSKLLLVLGLVLAVAGIVLAVALAKILAVGISVAAVGAVVTVLAFFVKPATKTLPAGEQDVLINQYFDIAQKYVYCQGKGYPEVQQELWQVYNDYSKDKAAYNTLLQTVKPTADTMGLEQDLVAMRRRQEEIRQTQQRLYADVGRLQEERRNLNTDQLPVQEQLQTVQQQLAEARHSNEVATLTLQLLLEAKENLSTGYLPELCTRCQTLLNQITGGNYQLVTDRSFALQLRVDGITKPLDNFSRGIREITLLCFRVALSQLLFDGHIPFMLVDDAFVNFDEDNFQNATKLLKQLSQETQVVYFTCHDRLGNLK